MTKNVNGPATAPTVPGHGSIIPQKETKMKHHLDSTKAMETPVSRRNFIAIAAAGSAALPAVALAEASGKTSRLPQSDLPIERFDRHAAGVSEALDEYLDGRFYACIYPSKREGFSCCLKDIEAEQLAQTVIEPRLLSLIEAHKRSHHAFYGSIDAVDVDEPTEAAQRRYAKAWKAEAAALNALISYVPLNDPSRRAKVRYIIPHIADAQVCDSQLRLLLISMCGRSA